MHMMCTHSILLTIHASDGAQVAAPARVVGEIGAGRLSGHNAAWQSEAMAAAPSMRAS